MKHGFKAALTAAAVLSGVALVGCATPLPLGMVYTNTKLPVSIGNGKMEYAKKGQSVSKTLFGLFAWGDSSINAACKDANIKDVSWINYEVNNFLGIYGTYTTVVYGK